MPRAISIYKLNNALAPEELQALLSDFYPRFAAKVTRVSVAPVPRPETSQRAVMKMYKAAFKKNESKNHSYLKWVGLRWCAGELFRAELRKYRYEVQIAYPDQLEFALSRPGKGEVVGEGMVLPHRHRYFLNDCIYKVADVFGAGQVVECGVTDPSSLVLPLAARVASRILWLHYPRDKDRADLIGFSAPCEGLLIERISQTSTAVKKSDRYPLKVLASGQHTFLIGRRDCQAEVLSHGGLRISYPR